METNNFAEQVAADAAAQKHNEEIQKTRIGGLGGSDAALIYRVGLNGLAGLTATDNKRLAIMLGLMQQEQWSGNAYTNAGHQFEQYVDANFMQLADGVVNFEKAEEKQNHFEREKYLETKIAKNFKTFAHADFWVNDNVVECKFVQKETDAVRKEYNPQLQWYYVQGANKVILMHGTGEVEPFEVKDVNIVVVERDYTTIDILYAGVKILDDAIASGWRPIIPDKINVLDAPVQVQYAFQKLESIKEQEAKLKAEKDEAAKEIKDFIEAFGYVGIMNCKEDGANVVYTRASVTKTFDSAKFLKEHPEFMNDENYWKTTKKSSSISMR